MGLRERIRNARGNIIVRAIRAESALRVSMRSAIAQSTDGGLLVHVAIERQGR